MANMPLETAVRLIKLNGAIFSLLGTMLSVDEEDFRNYAATSVHLTPSLREVFELVTLLYVALKRFDENEKTGINFEELAGDCPDAEK